jgi:membrane associated rhomboid family serine protease
VIPIKDNIPTDRLPLITVGLIVANVAAYVLAGHLSILQLIANVWFLWLFGNNVEDSTSPVRFLALYAAGGLVAVGLAVAVGSDRTAAGTAGAVSAVIGGYLLLNPRGRVLSVVVIPLLFTVIEVPVLAMAALWFLIQGAFAVAGEITFLASLGGLAVGLAAILPLSTRRKPTPPTATARP